MSKNKEEFIDKEEPGLIYRIGGSVTVGLFTAIDKYTRQEAINFVMFCCGEMFDKKTCNNNYKKYIEQSKQI